MAWRKSSIADAMDSERTLAKNKNQKPTSELKHDGLWDKETKACLTSQTVESGSLLFYYDQT